MSKYLLSPILWRYAILADEFMQLDEKVSQLIKLIQSSIFLHRSIFSDFS